MIENFSIIMPVFNSQKTVKDSIDSVLNQTHKNFKLYIINDCSTDNSKDIILSYSDKRIIYIENIKNQGVALSRNRAIEQCSGQYLAFLDSDDLWLPHKLESQLEKLESGYNIVCSNYTTFKNSSVLNMRISPEIITKSDMLKSNFIGNLTGVYNCKNLGKFYQRNTGHEDYIMWLDIINKAKLAYCIQEPLAKYRLSNSSLSSSKVKTIQWQWKIYRNELHLSLIKSIYYFSHYILNALRKRR